MTTPDPRMRASDADRQATVDRLADHFTAGRLTASEYDERVQKAYAATYLDELPVLTVDLPEPGAAAGPGRWQGFDEWIGARSPLGARSPFGGGPGGWAGPGGWPGSEGGRPGPGGWPGRGGPRGWGYRGHRRPLALLPVILVVLLLVGLTHGFILIPLVWVGLAMVIFGRRRGRCGGGRPFGPRSAR